MSKIDQDTFTSNPDHYHYNPSNHPVKASLAAAARL
jgi:hypothetical protein